ncbi:hypothetical protein [Streptomyces sp. MAI_2237]
MREICPAGGPVRAAAEQGARSWALADRDYARRRVDRSERGWFVAWTSERTFRTACGPVSLAEALGLFRTWVSEGAA